MSYKQIADKIQKVFEKRKFDTELQTYSYNFEEVTDLMIKMDKDLSKTYSRQEFERKARDLISKLEKEETLDEEVIKEVFKDLRKKPIQNFFVYRPLFGVEMNIDQPLRLGPFIIYKWDKHQNIIKELHPAYYRIEKIKNAMKLFSENVYLIAYEVEAREYKKAIQQADLMFVRFENIMRFIIDDPRRLRNVSIFSDYQWEINYALCLSTSAEIPKHAISLFGSGVIEKVDLCKVEKNPIWGLLIESSPMQQRILNAIQWLGKSLTDWNDPTKSLPQIIFALETLLGEQNQHYSISGRLADFSAYILSNELENRRKTSKFIREIYALRSKIVHGTADEINISVEMVSKAYKLVRNLILIFFRSNELNSIQTMEELNDWLDKKKFS